jgi:hypothetical protein
MAVIKDEQVARKILEHLGLSSIIPELGRVHEAPHWNFVPLRESDLWPTGPSTVSTGDRGRKTTPLRRICPSPGARGLRSALGHLRHLRLNHAPEHPHAAASRRSGGASFCSGCLLSLGGFAFVRRGLFCLSVRSAIASSSVNSVVLGGCLRIFRMMPRQDYVQRLNLQTTSVVRCPSHSKLAPQRQFLSQPAKH